MTSQSSIHVFSKPDCNFCARAKAVLQEEGLDYIEHDVAASAAMANASQYYSGSVSVPQIFVGSQHINGAEDLEALQQAGLLSLVVDQAEGELALDPALAEKWVAGSSDFTLAEHLDHVDISKQLEDPEVLLISHFYKGMFGFTPISYLYLGQWMEAYKACALSSVMAKFPLLAMGFGPETTFGLTYTASSTQGCAYCTVHTAATTGVEQTGFIKALQDARAGSPGPDNPYGDLQLAMVELTERATLNTVDDKLVERVKALAEDAGRDPRQAIEAAALGAEIMGLLNVFNDLLNVELEGGMAALAAQELGLEGERHAVTEADPDDLDFELPESVLTIETGLAARREKVSDWQGLAKEGLGHIPIWLTEWPEVVRPLFAGVYAELMGASEVSAELKHLMARIFAIAKGHEVLAASAAFSAHHVAEDKGRALERIRNCFPVAAGQTDTDLFDAAEKAALRLAWVSAQIPIVTQTQFAAPVLEHFSQRQIVELCVACGLACSVQRMASALQVNLCGEEEAFCRENGIETDTLKLRYPLS